MYKTGIILLWLAALVSCKKDRPGPSDEILVFNDALKTVSYRPTHCAEPWDAAPYRGNAMLRIDRMQNYLKDKGISALENLQVNGVGGGLAICDACSCRGAERISFGLSTSDYEKIKKVTPFSVDINQ